MMGNLKKSEWVSVDEKTPIDEQTVIAIDGRYVKGSKIMLCPDDIYGAFFKDGKFWSDCPSNDGTINLNFTTHWMPLPEPPKGVGDE
jgi:hypothetical protein